MNIESAYQNVTNFAASSLAYPAPSSLIGKFLRDVANHPYPRVYQGIPFSQRLFELTIRPQLPITIMFTYLFVIGWLNKNQDGKDRMKGKGWKAILVAHNLLLAAYSFWTFKGSAAATFGYFINGYQRAGLPGVIHTFCDSSMHLWDKGMGFYTYWFYLSKFWEILDTLILIGKGRKASFLQEYHHAGAIMTVWSGARYESPAAWLFVVFNSFVHTIMYSYYAISVLHWPFPGVLKRSLTKIQIAQFVVGGSLGALTLLLQLPVLKDSARFGWIPMIRGAQALERLGEGFEENSCLHTAGQKITVLGGVGYLIPLTGLFVSFYIQAYQRKRKLATATGDGGSKDFKAD